MLGGRQRRRTVYDQCWMCSSSPVQQVHCPWNGIWWEGFGSGGPMFVVASSISSSFKLATFSNRYFCRRKTARWRITQHVGRLGLRGTAHHWRRLRWDYTSRDWFASTLVADRLWRSCARRQSARLTNAPAQPKPLWMKQDKQGL